MNNIKAVSRDDGKLDGMENLGKNCRFLCNSVLDLLIIIITIMMIVARLYEQFLILYDPFEKDRVLCGHHRYGNVNLIIMLVTPAT